MTTGAPIYLVSACASGEEFVSAFRRYADRNGVVFIPTGQPLPPGKKGRFALTLKDGGVMVEGDAEVVSSAKTPSVLYGRVGMTLKFTAPDEPSKTLLSELEKARLAMKPPPPSVAPRPADIPAEPRPTPPTPGGRVDAVNALAECVVIGDITTLSGDDGPPRIPNPKFVVPSIPAMGPGARPKSPSGAVPVIPAPASKPITGGNPVVASPTATTMGMPPLEKKPASTRDQNELLQTVRGAAPAVDLLVPPPRSGGTAPPPIPKNATPAGALPVVAKQPTPATRATPAGPVPVPVAQPAPFVRPQTPPGALPIAPAPPIVAAPPPVVHAPDDADEPTDLNTLPIAPEPAPEKSGREPRKTVMGIAVVPSGMHVLPAAPARTTSAEEARDTSLMDAAAAEEMTAPAVITSKPPVDVPAAPPVAAAAVSAAHVEEHTPSGDWTMTVGDSGPTIMQTPRIGVSAKTPIEMPDPEEGAPIKQIPAGPPTGDWMIALDPSQPDGWSEPSRVEKRAEVLPGPPVSTVASEKDLDSEAKVAPQVKADEAKVEIDPTLMEPLQPLQPIVDFDDEPQLPPPPSTAMPAVQPPPQGPASAVNPTPVPMQMQPQMQPVVPMHMDGAMPGSYPTPVPGQGAAPTYPNAQMPQYLATEAMRAPDPHAAKKRRTLIIAASGAAVLLVIILAVAFSGGGGESKPDDTTPNAGSPNVVKTPDKEPPPPAKAGSAQQAIVQPAVPDDTSVEEPPAKPDAAERQVVATATDCEVELSSAPQGAEIVLDKSVIGTTPTKLTLPCGVESKLTFRKARYQATQRSVTPKPAGQKPVRIALARVTFVVKVSSSPAGANIMLGARSLGITPAAIKLPAFEASTLKITKDGYAPDIQKITPRTNNLSISSALKRNPVRKPR
ncbi:MAG: PEGA domain-containing protein [Deltaproteobacteria bacterium]|nr:PEGA domain-containing protein [Deltaproteobacteria bacterium]